jgi:hypothetical protein
MKMKMTVTECQFYGTDKEWAETKAEWAESGITTTVTKPMVDEEDPIEFTIEGPALWVLDALRDIGYDDQL